jgi:hypothetical protein
MEGLHPHVVGRIERDLAGHVPLAWVDRGGSARVPLFSTFLVGIMIVISMLMFARLMQRLGDLQIGNVLHLVGDQGRAVIGQMFRCPDDKSAASRASEATADRARLGPVTQTVKYFGKPRTIAKLADLQQCEKPSC